MRGCDSRRHDQVCGRFFLISNGREIADLFSLEESQVIEPRYNISPGQTAVIIRRDPDESSRRSLSFLTWGLVPSWSKGDRPRRFINARCETVQEKPAFRSAFRSRRCLMPANGFFEWSAGAEAKVPHVFQLRQRRLMAFAALWERWTNDRGEVIESCAVLTTQANELVSRVHDRMPVIVDHADFSPWLDSGHHDSDFFERVFHSLPAEKMECYPVSTHVNNPRSDGPECIAPVDSFPQKT